MKIQLLKTTRRLKVQFLKTDLKIQLLRTTLKIYIEENIKD